MTKAIVIGVIVLAFLGILIWNPGPGEKWVATVFHDGDVSTDGNNCRIEEKEGYRLILCKK